jgi:hypothetical protein
MADRDVSVGIEDKFSSVHLAIGDVLAEVKKANEKSERREEIKLGCEVASAIAAVLLPLVIFSAGSNVQKAVETSKQRTDIMQKFTMDVAKGESEAEPATVVIAQLVGNGEAIKLARLFPSEGTYSGLSKVASVEASAKKIGEAIGLYTAAAEVADLLPAASKKFKLTALFNIQRLYRDNGNRPKAVEYCRQIKSLLDSARKEEIDELTASIMKEDCENYLAGK